MEFAIPFIKNLAILCITVWLVLLVAAIKRLGLQGFSFPKWLEDSQTRFIVGFVFIFSLSSLMALTDVAPLFKVFGFDINASPVGLGLSIGAMLMAGLSTAQPVDSRKEKVQEIQEKAQSIIKTSAEIEKDNKTT